MNLIVLQGLGADRTSLLIRHGSLDAFSAENMTANG